MGDSSLVWAAYATAIATLTGLSSTSLGAGQRFSINPQSSYSIPVVPFVNQLYQNWAVSRFASVVPQKDIALLTPNGQTYDTAYGLYLDNVFIQIPNDPAVEAKINETAAKLTRFRTEIAALKKQAQLDYKSDCPNGIDAFSGEPTTLAEYAAVYYPEIADDVGNLVKEEAVRQELIQENLGGSQLARLNQWRSALNKGESQNVSYPNYNMGVLITDSSTVEGVSDGSTTPNSQASSYENAYIIGGQFNTVAKAWIDSFPPEYPGDRKRYDAGKSTYSIKNITSTSNDWSQFGWSQTTQSTGSDGWIFWQTKKTSTTTVTKHQLSIDRSSFGSGITVSVWGAAQFPINMGQWYQGNPLRTYPVLVNTAGASIKDDVKQQITSVIVGYGIEISFTLVDNAYKEFTGAVTTAKSQGGSLSIFGGIYGSSNGDSSSTTNSWDQIATNDAGKSVTLRAQNVKVPTVLGSVITTISS